MKDRVKINKEKRLGIDKITRVVLSLAIPGIITQLVNIAYTIVDRIYIGHMQNSEISLAAIGVAAPLVTFISSFAFWIGLGGGPLVAISLGSENKERAKKILSNSFIMLLAISLLLTVIILPMRRSLLFLCGATNKTIDIASKYLLYYGMGTIFAILSQGLNLFIVAQGLGKTGMAMILIGVVFNVILDPIFIFTFKMGVIGAAIASCISQLASALCSLIFLFSKRTYIKISFQKLDFKIINKILILGFSPFMIMATDSVIIFVLNKMLQIHSGDRADTIIAASTIVVSFMQLVTLPMGGITGGTQPFLGYNYGACNFDRVKKGQAFILLLALIYSTFMFILSRTIAEYFAKIFTSNKELIEISVKFIKIYTIGIIPLAFQYSLVDGLTGMSIAKVAIGLSMFRKIILMLPLTFIIPIYYGYKGAFYAEPIADILSSIVATITYLFLINKLLEKRKKVVEKEKNLA